MTSRDFCYWLQGFFELQDDNRSPFTISPSQVATIRRHLSMVFEHEIDPSIDKGDKQKQQILQNIHDGLSHVFDSNVLVRC